MRNIDAIYCGMLTLAVASSNAMTIESMADKNNQLLELDQDIAIAEKSKKLTELKSRSVPLDTILLPKAATDYISVLSVHGSPQNPIVDIQYGGAMYHRRRGDNLPEGWKIIVIDNATVTIVRSLAGKTKETRTLLIGQHAMSSVPGNLPVELAFPNHILAGE